jgi:hypothetical protein
MTLGIILMVGVLTPLAGCQTTSSTVDSSDSELTSTSLKCDNNERVDSWSLGSFVVHICNKQLAENAPEKRIDYFWQSDCPEGYTSLPDGDLYIAGIRSSHACSGATNEVRKEHEFHESRLYFYSKQCPSGYVVEAQTPKIKLCRRG